MKYKFILLILALLAAQLMAEDVGVKTAAAQDTSSGTDTGQSVTVLQEEFLKLKFGMFLHFNLETYKGVQWVAGYDDPSTFNPGVETIDTDAWADAAVAAGMKYGVLTVKHVSGFCLWDSKYTTYDVMNPKCPYQKDLVAQFVKSFKSRGLKVGLYYCWRNPGFGSVDKYKVLPPECDPATHTPAQQIEFQKAQIAELLNKYPDVFYIWNDGLDPEIMPAKETLTYFRGIRPDVIASANWWDWKKKGRPYADLAVTETKHFPAGNKTAGETCWCLEQAWFWNETFRPKAAKEIVQQLSLANSRNANFLLNVAPNKQGKLSEASVKTLKEIGGLSKANPQSLMLPDPAQTPRMRKWIDYRYGLFIHFNINTFVGTEQVPNPPPATTYAPKGLDVDSWVRLARDAGMKYAVLTTKHSGGFCLWDSKVQWHGKEFEYDVAASSNKTDVVKAFMIACKKYDIAPGLYYCLGDSYSNPALVNKTNGKFNWWGRNLPKEVFELVHAHLDELATNYPECRYFWLDVPSTASIDQQAALYSLLRRKNPDNVVLLNSHLAGPKTKEGAGADTGDQTLLEKGKASAYPSDVLNTEAWQRPKGKVSRIQQWKGKTLFMGYEHCDNAGSSWFNPQKPKSANDLFKLYRTIRQSGGNLLLDVGPTRQGVVAPAYRKLLLELKGKIEAYEKSLPPAQ